MGILSRLRHMPAREIGFRLRERISLETERMLGTAASVPAPRVLDTLAARFYISPEERKTLPSFVRANFPEWVRAAITEADALCDHRLELLGYGTVQLGAD